MQKVATGKADIGQSDSTNTLLAIAQGLPIIQIGAVFQNDPSVLMLHADNPVKRFEDLDGKTIMARPEWAFLPYLRNKYHINFNIIPQNFAVANFIANPNFIQQGYYTAEPYYIVKGGAKYPKFLFAWDAGFDAYTSLVANRALGRAATPTASARSWRPTSGAGKTTSRATPPRRNTLMKRLNPNNTDEFLAFSPQDDHQREAGRRARTPRTIRRPAGSRRERFALQIHQLEDLGILPKGSLTVDQVMTTAYLP